MAVESGREYNPDTAKDLRDRAFTFQACGVVFRFTLQIPEYILARLNNLETMDKLQEHMAGHASEVVTDALKSGYFDTPKGEAAMRRDMSLHLKNYIWERFSITQEKAGQECWQTADTLQKVHKL